MKTTLVIPSICAVDIPVEAFDALVDIYPQGERIDMKDIQYWGTRLPATDPRATAVIDILKKHNLKPWGEGIRARFEREYSKKDLTDAPYLSPQFARSFGAYEERNEDGLLKKHAQDIQPKSLIGGSWGGAVFIALELKALIEDEDFLGAKIQRIELTGMPSKATEGKFRELTSTITLPPMSPRMAFFASAGAGEIQEVDADYPKPSILREGRDLPEILVDIPALHYSKSDLADMPAFDIALTYEQFGQNKPHTVFSQRFYQFCLQHKLPIGWIPIYVDEA